MTARQNFRCNRWGNATDLIKRNECWAELLMLSLKVCNCCDLEQMGVNKAQIMGYTSLNT
jgi:hypothetical protein